MCAGPAPNHGFTELLHAVRACQKEGGARPTFLPFLPDSLGGIAARMVGQSLGANRHRHYGHTFGSDPWIGLAEWLRERAPDAACQALVGAFAYDGYYTLGCVEVGPGTRVELRVDMAGGGGGGRP